MSSAINRIGQISLTVSDVPRAVAFYRDQVGLQFLFEYPGLAFFLCGGVRIMLTLPEAGNAPQNSVFYFAVDDIDATFADLGGKGVTFVDEPHMIARMPDHELWMVFFRDPDGNLMGIMCEKR